MGKKDYQRPSRTAIKRERTFLRRSNAASLAHHLVILLCDKEHYNHIPEKVFSHDRTKESADIRSIVMSVLRELGYTLLDIADVFDRTHQTVSYSIKTFGKKLNDYLTAGEYSFALEHAVAWEQQKHKEKKKQ